jgi:UDP-GlcNAc:undecaprenyl-phosphate/decaprenyl-phosphate GlcNAc-1-phosphate transferase
MTAMNHFIVDTVLPSFLVTWAMGFAVRKLAPKCGLVDQPGHRKVHSTPVPLGGGLAIWFGIVLPLGMVVTWVMIGGPSAWVDRYDQLNAYQTLILPHIDGFKERIPDLLFLLGCATVLMLLGFLDDWRGLDWRLRILIQLAVAAAVVFGKGWRLTFFVDIPMVTNLLSVIWIVGLINSFNMLDNMDGLSAGVAAIAAAMLAALLLVAPDPENHGPQLFVAGFLLVLVGSLSGFLWHNRPPARLFMGDAGSYLIGFLIAVMAMLGTFAGGSLPRHAVLAPLCVLAVPLYDTISVVCIRLRAGRSPFEGDKNHFSHRLVDLGLTKPQAVLTIYLTTAACGLSALVLHQVNPAGAITIVLSIVCLLAVIAILETTARRKVADRNANSGHPPQ